MTFEKLNAKLIKHYDCFNSERFWLDYYNPEESSPYVIIVTASISDTCPVHLCKCIARYVQKLCKHTLSCVYVGAWAFKGDSL